MPTLPFSRGDEEGTTQPRSIGSTRMDRQSLIVSLGFYSVWPTTGTFRGQGTESVDVDSLRVYERCTLFQVLDAGDGTASCLSQSLLCWGLLLRGENLTWDSLIRRDPIETL